MIVAVVSTSATPATIRMPVLIVVGAVYGYLLALAGVRIAAVAVESKMPELCQAAIRSKL